jgi:hypothetical protein
MGHRSIAPSPSRTFWRRARWINPDEGIWHYLKHVELRNLCCANLAELRLELGLAIRRLRHKRHVLRGCITECGYAAAGVPGAEVLHRDLVTEGLAA